MDSFGRSRVVALAACLSVTFLLFCCGSAVAGAIRGTVTAGGMPVRDIEVIAYTPSYPSYKRAGYAYTNDMGAYVISALAGTYKVQFFDPSGAYLQQWYSGADSFATASEVAVPLYGTTGGIDASLVEGGRITGTVTAGGSPMSEVGVAAYTLEGDQVAWTYTLQSGNYTMDGLRSGTYKVLFSDYWGRVFAEWYDSASSFETATGVPVTAGQTTAGIDASLVVGGRITGTVTAGGKPLQEVEVCVYDLDEDHVGCASTDDEGVYTVGGLQTGTYKVSFLDFSETYLGQWYEGATSFETATGVPVTVGQTTAGIDASMLVGGRITGTVTAGGRPLPWAEVCVYDLDEDHAGCASTDEEGFYTVGGLQTGTYKVHFSDDSGAYLEQWYRGVSSFAAAAKVPVTANMTTSGINASLVLGGRITGRVTGGGIFVPGIRVYVCDLEGEDAGSSFTDERGGYTVEGLKAGLYKVQFYDHSRTYFTQWYRGVASFITASAVSAAPGKTTSGIDASLVLGGSIAGTVTADGSPLTGATVTVYDSNDREVGSASSDWDGDYAVGGLWAGTYRVRFADGGGAYLSQWHSGAASFQSARGVPVALGRATGGVNASLVRGGAISGTVTVGGNPAEDVGVAVYNMVGDLVAHSDAYGGVYTVSGLSTGMYKVEFSECSGPCLRQWYGGAPSFSAAARVVVAAGETTAGIDASLPSRGGITGTVTAEGAPVQDAEVLLYSPDRDGLSSVSTDALGEYSFQGLPPATYKIEFRDRAGLHAPQWYDGAASFETAAGVQVPAGGTTDGIDASLVVGGSIAGTVTSGGVPVPGVSVVAYDRSRAEVGRSSTDDKGAYAVGGLATGAYRIRFTIFPGVYRGQWHSGAESFETAAEVPVAAGETTGGIDAALITWGMIAGTVTAGGAPVENVRVEVYDLGRKWVGQGISDRDGAYLVGGLDAGRYKVFFGKVTGSTGGYCRQWYPGASSFESAGEVTVALGATTPGIDATLAPGGRVAGRVTAGGKPLPDAGIHAYNLNQELVGSASSEEDGTYQVAGLPAGRYKIRFTGYSDTHLPQWFSRAPSFGAAAAVSVAAGRTTGGIDASLAGGGVITGTVTAEGRPLEDIEVEVYDAGHRQVGGSYTDEGGAYLVGGLPSGSYKLLFRDHSAAYREQWYRGAASFAAADGVPVAAGSVRGGTDVSMSPGARIAGRVTAAGSPVRDAEVIVYDPGEKQIGLGYTDEDGFYLIGGLPTGICAVRFHPHDEYVDLQQWHRNAFSFRTATRVLLLAGETRSGIDGSLVLGPPTDLELSSASVPESKPAGTTVGMLSTTDADPGEAHRYTLVRGEGDGDNGRFAISGSALRTAASFDYESNGTCGIRVRSTDGAGLYFEKPLVISVLDVNEAPTADAGGPYTVIPSGGVVVDGSASRDPDAGDSITAYEWDLDGDGRYGDGTGATLALTPVQVEALVCGGGCLDGHAYSIALRVTSSGGLQGEDAATLTAAGGGRPYAVAGVLPNPAQCVQTVIFDGAASVHGDAARAIVSYEWDFDHDGTFVSDAVGMTVTHTYGDSGEHTAALRVTDDGMPPRSDTTTVTAVVGGAEPYAVAGGPYVITEGRSLRLTAAESDTPDAGCGTRLSNFDWDLDDDADHDDARGGEVTLRWDEVVGRICGGDCALNSPYPIRVVVMDHLGRASVGETTVTIKALDTAVRLISPNGGEFLETGAPQEVRWLSAGVDRVEVFLLSGTPGRWVRLFSAPAAEGTHEWAPSPAGFKVVKRASRLRIDGYAGGLRVGSDVSDAPFAIGPLDLTSPDGGEELIPGDTVTVEWVSCLTSARASRTVVRYTLDGGARWQTAATLAGNPGNFAWRVPSPARRSDRSAVRVLLFDGMDRLLGQDQSERWFAILGKVDLTAPEIGDQVYGQTSRAVTWVTSTERTVSSASLRYTLDGGSSWKALPPIPGNPGKVYWDAPGTAKELPKCRFEVTLKNARGETVGVDSGEGWFSLLPRP